MGTRGLPARYGGFETLAEVLAAKLTHLQITVPGSRNCRRSLGYFWTYLENPISQVRTLVRYRPERNSLVLILNPANVLILLYAKSKGCTVALHLDGHDELRPKWPIGIRKMIGAFQEYGKISGAKLIVDSVAIQREYQNSRGFTPEVIGYGGCQQCEMSIRNFWSPSSSGQFLALGRPVPENQLITIISSINASFRPVHLVAVFEGRTRSKYLKQLIETIDTSQRVTHAGGIWDRERLCSMYREASAVIHGHTVGGTNPSLVLALCHGTPVLAHDNPYNREVAGSLARYWKTEQELTKLLDEFDPAAWPYDQAAVDDFNRRYNWDDVVEKYKRVLGLD